MAGSARLAAILKFFPYAALFFIICYLVAAPLGLLALASFKATSSALPLEPAALTFANYQRAYFQAGSGDVLVNTLSVGVFSVAVSISIASAMAWVTQRTNAPLRGLIRLAMLLPIGIPGMLLAIAWVLLFNPQNGVVNVWLRGLLDLEGPGPINLYTLAGICVLQGVSMVPSCYLMMSGAFRQMDPTLEEAALASGASWRQIISHITLPLLLPTIVATAIYFFVFAIEAFEIPGVIGVSAGIGVLSSRIYWASHPSGALPDYGYIAALATPLVVASIALMVAYGRLTRSSEKFVTITGRGFQPRLIDLGRFRWLPTLFAGAYLLITIVLPLAVLLWGSLFTYWVNPSPDVLPKISMAAYRATFNYPGVLRALGNTLIVIFVSATVTMLLASLLSWTVIRTKFRGRRLLDTLAFLPNSIPGIVIGLALIFVYLTIPIGIYGTVWIIVVACITRFLAYASRAMNAAQLQISTDLEEAAAVSGASFSKLFMTIVLPLLAVSFRDGWIWVAMHAARELSASVMLYGPSSVVLSTIIWSMWQNGRLPETCVLGVLLVLGSMALGVLGNKLGRKYS
jgi:iron(III) transport system permease protein